MFNFFRRKKDNLPPQLVEGLELTHDPYPQEENRRYTLMVKGFITYLLVMGALGGFLSALDIEYFGIIVNLVVLVFAVTCSLIYYSRFWSNIGYFLLLAGIVSYVLLTWQYINSGFYSVINDFYLKASNYFANDVTRNYTEQIGNRMLAITISMSFLGCIACVLVNMTAIKRMSLGAVLAVCFFSFIIPLYINGEPSGIYNAMLLTGLISVFIMHRSNHYQISFDNYSFKYDDKKRRFLYTYSWKSTIGAIGLIFIVCIFVQAIAGVIVPRDQYAENRVPSQWKQDSRDSVETFISTGIWGLMNINSGNGGMSSGQLGNVGSVRMDNQTDLQIEMPLYSYDYVYLKYFEGIKYVPFENRWINDGSVSKISNADIFQKEYENGNSFIGKGKMIVSSIDAYYGTYLPYYSLDSSKILAPGTNEEYTFYTISENQNLNLNIGEKESPFLDIPPENYQVIADFCEELNLNGNSDEIVQQLVAYYQENVPYTLNPGRTPRNKDFINYFLTENKKGFCSYFASAATLIFRYEGIPARYVEGYAISPSDIAENANIMQGAVYSDYFNGYAEINGTAVIRINATDANAHAWVEIYDDDRGWHIADVTPYSTEPEEDNSNFWTRFQDLLNGNQNNDNENAANTGGGNNNSAMGSMMARLFGLLFIFVIIVFLAIVFVYRVVKYLRFSAANRSDKLIILFKRYFKKLNHDDYSDDKKINYRQQINWIAENTEKPLTEEEYERCIEIMEKAGFGKDEITEAEFEDACRLFAK